MSATGYFRRYAVQMSLPLLVLLSGNTTDGAQASENTEVLTVLEGLVGGTNVRVLSRNASRVEGTIARLNDREVVIGAEESGEVVVSLHDVDTVWAKGDQANQGAVRGVLYGGLTGGVIMAVQESPVDQVALFSFGTVAGAFFGAVLGSVIGTQVPKWELVFQRR